MRVGFAGTPAFAVAALEAILAAGFDVPIVLTRPDAPKGRGLELAPSDVKRAALARGLDIAQPSTLRDRDAQSTLASTRVDVLVVAAYGLLLPKPVLESPRLGCVNIHASLLPRWRGAAPVQRAILAGDTETGISLMRMDEGLDTGPIIRRVPLSIEAHETAGTLTSALARHGAREIAGALHDIAANDRIDARPQPIDGVTYAPKIDRSETTIDWRESAVAIDRKVRAFDPAPGAQSRLAGTPVKIWASAPCDGTHAPPGSILGVDREGVRVACGQGVLAVRELQPAGGRRMPAQAFFAGRPLAPGMAFGS